MIMPRKQNGWGNTKSLGFKNFGRTDVGKKPGAPGSYPSNRSFGSSVTRTVIEKYNLDSNWTKWRKGYEYSVKAAWYPLEELDPITQEYETVQIQSKLYQGTPDEMDVVFDGKKFATKNSDSNNHYVLKRIVTSDVDLGTIRSILNDPLKYVEQRQNREIWCKGESGANSRILGRMIGDRITDGETEATLKNVLTTEELPAIYVGKTFDDPTTVTLSIPKPTLIENEGVEFGFQELVGKICYLPIFYIEKPLSDVDSVEFIDDRDFFQVKLLDSYDGAEVLILDPSEEDLPPTLLDIRSLPVLYTSEDATVTIQGSYLYEKSEYQKYYKQQYLTADVVEPQVEQCSYTVLPFTILGVGEEGDTLTITSVPFDSEFRLAADLGPAPILIFTDWSFTKTTIDEYDGVYYHDIDFNDPSIWRLLDTDIDPWMDEIFSTQNALKPAVMYSCSCPNHSQSQLRMPQSSQDEATKKTNRQLRYPLPSVLGKTDYDALSSNKAAGRFASWESYEHRYGFKMCKHSIASMFIDDIKVREPSTVPTIEARQSFEIKLAEEMDEVGDEFNASYRRGGITAIEVVFALAQGLNLDDVETAYVILNSIF